MNMYMIKPNAEGYKCDSNYIMDLIDESEFTIRETAKIIGIASSTLRAFISGRKTVPYTVQYAIECLCCQTKEK